MKFYILGLISLLVLSCSSRKIDSVLFYLYPDVTVDELAQNGYKLVLDDVLIYRKEISDTLEIIFQFDSPRRLVSQTWVLAPENGIYDNKKLENILSRNYLTPVTEVGFGKIFAVVSLLNNGVYLCKVYDGKLQVYYYFVKLKEEIKPFVLPSDYGD